MNLSDISTFLFCAGAIVSIVALILGPFRSRGSVSESNPTVERIKQLKQQIPERRRNVGELRAHQVLEKVAAIEARIRDATQ
jgi:hypothetical protein